MDPLPHATSGRRDARLRNGEGPMELREYLRGLRRHWLAILLMTLVGLATAFGWYLLQAPVYQATAVGLVQTKTTAEDPNLNGTLGPQFDAYARSKMPTYIEMATWKDVAEGAIDKPALKVSADQAFGRIPLENPADTNLIRVTATGDSPVAAASLATAWLESLSTTIDKTEGDGTPGSADVKIKVKQSALLPDT